MHTKKNAHREISKKFIKPTGATFCQVGRPDVQSQGSSKKFSRRLNLAKGKRQMVPARLSFLGRGFQNQKPEETPCGASGNRGGEFLAYGASWLESSRRGKTTRLS
jgi:hypothetical protein